VVVIYLLDYRKAPVTASPPAQHICNQNAASGIKQVDHNHGMQES